MFSGALLGESPLLSTLFANPAIDESFEAVFNPSSTEQIKFLPIHCFYARENVFLFGQCP